eukprot:s728_g43.t2
MATSSLRPSAAESNQQSFVEESSQRARKTGTARVSLDGNVHKTVYNTAQVVAPALFPQAGESGELILAMATSKVGKEMPGLLGSLILAVATSKVCKEMPGLLGPLILAVATSKVCKEMPGLLGPLTLAVATSKVGKEMPGLLGPVASKVCKEMPGLLGPLILAVETSKVCKEMPGLLGPLTLAVATSKVGKEMPGLEMPGLLGPLILAMATSKAWRDHVQQANAVAAENIMRGKRVDESESAASSYKGEEQGRLILGLEAKPRVILPRPKTIAARSQVPPRPKTIAARSQVPEPAVPPKPKAAAKEPVLPARSQVGEPAVIVPPTPKAKAEPAKEPVVVPAKFPLKYMHQDLPDITRQWVQDQKAAAIKQKAEEAEAYRNSLSKRVEVVAQQLHLQESVKAASVEVPPSWCRDAGMPGCFLSGQIFSQVSAAYGKDGTLLQLQCNQNLPRVPEAPSDSTVCKLQV